MTTSPLDGLLAPQFMAGDDERSCARSLAMAPCTLGAARAMGARWYGKGATFMPLASPMPHRQSLTCYEMKGSALRGPKSEPWPLESEDDLAPEAYPLACAHKGEGGPPFSFVSGEEVAGHHPWRECFAVIAPIGTPVGQRQHPANVACPQPTPEQVAARLRKLGGARRNLECEVAELGADPAAHARTLPREAGQQIATDGEGLPLFDCPR